MLQILIALGLFLLFVGTLWRLYTLRRNHPHLKAWAEVMGVLYLLTTATLLLFVFLVAPPQGVTVLKGATMSLVTFMFVILSILILLGPSRTTVPAE